MRADRMHLDICLDGLHEVFDAVSAHFRDDRIRGVNRGLERWPTELRGKIRGVQFQHDAFKMLCRCKAEFSIPQAWPCFDHYLLNAFFVCLDGFRRHLRVWTEHSAAHDLQRKRDDPAEGFKIRQFARRRAFAICDFRLAYCCCGWSIVGEREVAVLPCHGPPNMSPPVPLVW